MDKMESLRAGVAELRSVARKLNQWADDLETSIHNQEGEESEVSVSETVSTVTKAEKPEPESARPSAAQKAEKPITLPEIRAILAEKCAAGFATQVKALIESYGVFSLKDVPADHYGELLEAVNSLGGADA